ncbi:MAG: hypothetical protein WC707_04340 [Candidatus Babeliaceae bacterium]|jgi:hypothetical protein
MKNALCMYVMCLALRNPFAYGPHENVVGVGAFLCDNTQVSVIQEGTDIKIITRAKKSPST